MKELTSIKELSTLKKLEKGQTHDDSWDGKGSHMTTYSHVLYHVKLPLLKDLNAFTHLTKKWESPKNC